jgi:hypothetical protein
MRVKDKDTLIDCLNEHGVQPRDYSFVIGSKHIKLFVYGRLALVISKNPDASFDTRNTVGNLRRFLRRHVHGRV